MSSRASPPFTRWREARHFPTVLLMTTDTPRQTIVFTAIEGTLLDLETFDWSASRSILGELSAAGIPVVPVTAMTLDEMEPLAREMGLRHAMIIEAGGAIARWKHHAWQVEPCGPDADTLLDLVSTIEDRSGADLTVYSVLPEGEASRLSGRTGAMLRDSTRRRFSEPFVMERGDIEDVTKAAAALGFSIERGKRFYHLCRPGCETEAVNRVRAELGCDIAIALGGSPLDAQFLACSEIPIIVPGLDGLPDADLLKQVPEAWVAPAPGSRGWAAAMNAWTSVIKHPQAASNRARTSTPQEKDSRDALRS
jgi:mannosyl-3-phosphoglycerate phosphatase family protein